MVGLLDAFTRLGKQQSNDTLEAYPTRVQVTALPERRYLWTARAFAIMASVSLCLNIVLVLALFQLIPLKQVQPFFVTFASKSDQIVQIEPIEMSLSAEEAMTERLVREYVVQRNTIVPNESEMVRRWGSQGPIRWMSDPAEYAKFTQQAEPALSRITTDGLSREAEILAVSKLSDTLWQVEFETIDMTPEIDEPVIQTWQATLQIGFSRARVKYDDRLNNPLGFVVRSYNLARKRRGSGED